MIQMRFKEYKRKIITSLLVFGIILISAGMFTTTARATDDQSSIKNKLIKGYSVYYEGQNIGIVEDKKDIESIAESIRQGFEVEFNMKTIVEHNIEFEEILAEEQFFCSMDSIAKILRANANPKVEAALLQVDGGTIGILRDDEEAQSILDSIVEPYKNACEESGGKIEEVDFEEQVVVTTSYIDYEELDEAQLVFNRCIEEEYEKQKYIVEKGENVWVIVEKNNITLQELLDANIPMKQSDILQIGQELNLNIPEMLINVLTVEGIEYTEAIAFETEIKKTDSLYTNQTKVSQEGQKGEREVEARLHKRNGIIKDREIISETVTKEPVKEILLEGTKKTKNKTTTTRSSSSGSFMWPTSGRISSYYGPRWGKFHGGVDIAAPKGTPIYAADGGTISYSAFNDGGYGNLVKISHGGGIVTYYGHMSSRSVSKGTKVSKGQLIGYVGSTGRSTGPHLHFEVRVNGDRKNPMNYLN